MHSVILRIAAKHLLLPFLFISLVVLMRGHDLPGGGFIGGLVAAVAFILYTVAFGVEKTKAKLRIDPQKFIGAGLATSMIATLIPVFMGKPLMTGTWFDLHFPLGIDFHFGTPVLFDFGVYLVVFGVLLTIVFVLSEDK